jgi:hypothetical protein
VRLSRTARLQVRDGTRDGRAKAYCAMSAAATSPMKTALATSRRATQRNIDFMGSTVPLRGGRELMYIK